MARSKYTDSVVLTNNHSGRRTHKVQAFVIHHMAAVWSGRRCAESFLPRSRGASANYCIGYNGDVCLNVEEENRAWTSSSNWADQRAITFELANSKYGHPWPISDATLKKAILVLADLHKRYGLRASYTGNTNGTLWRHDWFANTNCPGPSLGGLLPHIAKEVNKILDGGKVPSAPKTKKTESQIVDEVIAGKHGNGAVRKNRLKQLGFNPHRVQRLVNERILGKPKVAKKSEKQIAEEVKRGLHGNGQARFNKLKKMGYDPQRIQNLVNTSMGVKSAPKNKTLHLPANASSWRIYRQGGPYTVGSEIGYLAPSKFGGLKYSIKGNPMKDIYLIDTRDFGRVAIYAGAGTSAQVR